MPDLLPAGFPLRLGSIFKLGHNVRHTVGGRCTWEISDFSIAFTVPGKLSAAANTTFSDPTGRAPKISVNAGLDYGLQVREAARLPA